MDRLPPWRELTLLIIKYHTLIFAAFSTTLVKIPALLTILIPHWSCRRLMLMLRFFLHLALVCAQPPFRKVHGSTSFQKGHKKIPSFMRANCYTARLYSVLSLLFLLPLPVPAFKQLDDQIFFLLFGKVLRKEAVDAFAPDLEFFFLVRFFFRENGKDDIHI